MRDSWIEAAKLNYCIQVFELVFETCKGPKVLDSLLHGEPLHNEEVVICHGITKSR